eukprot:COSAG05_NODE_8694_length_680_cov_0.796902_1_plen_33_part_10
MVFIALTSIRPGAEVPSEPGHELLGNRIVRFDC